MIATTRKTELDWEALRKRLAAARQATADALTLSPERAQRLLDERAHALARAGEEAEAGERIELFTFELEGEWYAVETRYVREVCRPPERTPLPGAADFLTGVVNLRGEVLAIVDLPRALGLPAAPPQSAWLIVLGNERAEFGVCCGQVGEVRMLAVDALHAANGHAATACLRGVTAEALLVLDGAALLADKRLVVEE